MSGSLHTEAGPGSKRLSARAQDSGPYDTGWSGKPLATAVVVVRGGDGCGGGAPRAGGERTGKVVASDAGSLLLGRCLLTSRDRRGAKGGICETGT